MKKLFLLLILALQFVTCNPYKKLTDIDHPLLATAVYQQQNGKYVIEYKGQDIEGKPIYIYVVSDTAVAIGSTFRH